MGFGIKKEAGSSTTPSQIVNFDQLTPTTVGVVFDPNTPATEDVLYVSSVDASTWIWNGTAYVTYVAPTTANTEWYLTGTTIDAGGNKTASIQRSGAIRVSNDSYFNDVRIGRGNSNIVTNTVVGNAAGGNISTGSSNTFFGRDSGKNNTIGSGNTASGIASFFSNTTGDSNTANGTFSLALNTTGGGNTGNGIDSLHSNTTGSFNTASGYRAGRYIADGTTGNTVTNNSVFLGSGTKALANNQTNQIVIGYNTIGKGSNTVNIGNTSITNTYLNGAVTFNNAFTFPTTDGTANYFLKTNGSGVVTWGVAGLSYFSEAQNTTAPNATVPVDSLTAVSTTTNADMALLPKGTGAFIVGHIPDGTIANGGKRGAGAVEIRSAESMNYYAGASGVNSISIGKNTQSTQTGGVAIGLGCSSTGIGAIAMGNGNDVTASGSQSVAIQGSSNATNTLSFAIQGGSATGVNALAGANSIASGSYSVALGGVAFEGANASGICSFAVGQSVLADARNSLAFGITSSTKGVPSRLSLGSHQDISPYVKGNSQLSLSSTTITTSTNTVGELVTYAGTAIALVLQNNEAIRVRGSIIGKQTASTNVSCYDFDCVVVRGTTAGSTILPLSNINLVLDTITLDTIPTLTANTASGGLSVKSGAKTTTTIKWSCRIDSTEVILA